MHFCVFLVTISLLLVDSEPKKISPTETVQAIKNEGYPVKVYDVETSDGYILEVHRIPHGKFNKFNKNRPVVFLMHGLLSSSVTYISQGSRHSLGYILADSGFDVWMGNARGNRNSRRHKFLDPDRDAQKFFDFSWDEIGLIDLPAMIDFALKTTGQERLHYIGHSQGGTVFFVLMSTTPKYNKMIITADLLAGAGFQTKFPSRLLSTASITVDAAYAVAKKTGVYELYPSKNSSKIEKLRFTKKYTAEELCTGNVTNNEVCKLLKVKMFLPVDIRGLSFWSYLDFDPITVGGASVKQVVHFLQNIRDKQFRKFHYGRKKNKVLYGQKQPPIYNLTRITCDVILHYSDQDKMVGARDSELMAATIPNARPRKVKSNNFTHGDFTASPMAKTLVYDYIITRMKKKRSVTFLEEKITSINKTLAIKPKTLKDSNIFDRLFISDDDSSSEEPTDTNDNRTVSDSGVTSGSNDSNGGSDSSGDSDSTSDDSDRYSDDRSNTFVLDVILKLYLTGFISYILLF